MLPAIQRVTVPSGPDVRHSRSLESWLGPNILEYIDSGMRGPGRAPRDPVHDGMAR